MPIFSQDLDEYTHTEDLLSEEEFWQLVGHDGGRIKKVYDGPESLVCLVLASDDGVESESIESISLDSEFPLDEKILKTLRLVRGDM